jgi:serine/threonine protein kinase
MISYLGQRFGHYVLVEPIDQGGFADVYLGRHVYLRTYAAVKVLKMHLGRRERRKFLQEARTIAILEHSHIVRILDFGMKGGTPYLVMNYAPNGSLRKKHPQGERLPMETILGYLQQLAEALDYIHHHGVIHLDIKPENMLLGRNNEVLLSDFGIAVIVGKASAEQADNFTGTLAYIAPERILGKPSPASDQYSLGVVIYEWLTGERPFYGSREQVVWQHMYTPPPSLCRKSSAISPEVEQVVLKSLQKDPKRRFTSVQDFVNALRRASNHSISPEEVRPQIPVSQRTDAWEEMAKIFIRDLFTSIILGSITYLFGMILNSAWFVFGLSLLTLPLIDAFTKRNQPAKIFALATLITSVIVGIKFQSLPLLSMTQFGLLLLCSWIVFLWGIIRKFF